MNGKTIKIKMPDGVEKDLKDIKFIHFIYEKSDAKIIKSSEGQISGHYLQIQFKFSNEQNYIFVSEKPPGQPNTALVGIPAAYQGKSLSFLIEQTDKETRKKIASSSTDDGSRWDDVYEGNGSNASLITIMNMDVPTEQGIFKGGNSNPETWKVIPMKQDPSLFKIVDDQGENVRTDFSSQQAAEKYVAYEIYKKKNDTFTPNNGSRNNLKDKLGVVIQFKTKDNGKEMYSEDFMHERGIRHYESDKPDDTTDEYNVKLDKEHVDLETTGYFKITKEMHDDTISMKLRGPTHSDGKGSWYKIGVHFNGKPFFGKEWEHSGREEDDLNTGDNIINAGKIVGKWVGVKAVTFNEEKNGKKGVRCQCYVDGPYDNIGDVPPEKQNWRKTFDVFDTADPILKGNEKGGGDTMQIQFRIDATGDKDGDEMEPGATGDHKYDFNKCIKESHTAALAKFLSCRQIDPNK